MSDLVEVLELLRSASLAPNWELEFHSLFNYSELLLPVWGVSIFNSAQILLLEIN